MKKIKLNNVSWGISWKAMKETTQQLDISTANKEILLKHLDILTAYHEVPPDIFDFFDSVASYYGLVFMLELFAHFVKNGIIEFEDFSII